TVTLVSVGAWKDRWGEHRNGVVQGISRHGPGPPHHRRAAAQGHHGRVQGTARHSQPDERQHPMLITTTHKIRAVLAVAAATIIGTGRRGSGPPHLSARAMRSPP